MSLSLWRENTSSEMHHRASTFRGLTMRNKTLPKLQPQPSLRPSNLLKTETFYNERRFV